VYLDLLSIAEDELDWPDMSSATAFKNSTWTGHPMGPVDSGYLRTRKINLCNHRDYQNIAVNGARSSSMLDNIIKTFARNQTTDHPTFLTYALVGNDVCNHSPDVNSMTTPQEFYQNVVGAMQYLDTILPFGSHVTFLGLADGRILYDTMYDRIHPIGSYFKDVTYSQFYDFLNCLQISPCHGWMNSDSYWRNVTTERAFELNDVYKAIVANNTFKNFDMHYFDTPLQEVIDLWKSMGGQTWQLIELVDGFHPSQISDALVVDVLWKMYAAQNLLPPVNPYNAMIASLFGDQGGYDP